MSTPSPGNILRYALGPWLCAIPATAVRLGTFAAIARGAHDARALATRIHMTEHKAQALLDGLLGLGLVTLEGGAYRNTDETARYLLPTSADYLGDLLLLGAASTGTWSRLAESVQSGEPALASFDPREHPDWEALVRGIAPLALVGARAAAARLGIEDRRSFRMLDLGGGAGAYSSVWLALAPAARAVQIDWSNVNGVAREYVAGFGVGDRFETRDGDIREVDLGTAEHDYVVLSLVAHFFAADDNRALFARIRRALVPGGTLVLGDIMLDEHGGGGLWPLLYQANMLLASRTGASYSRTDYRGWLSEAGFTTIEIEAPAAMPYTLLLCSTPEEPVHRGGGEEHQGGEGDGEGDGGR